MELIELKEKINNQISQLKGPVAISAKFILTQESININDQLQFWAASVIKIPIACEVFRQTEAQKLQLTSRVKIMDENLVDGTGVIKLLDRNDEFTLLDLVKLMLTISDNTATNQIVDLIGWENVEIYMKELGLVNTTYRHKMMIKAGRGPNLTTADDIKTLLEKLYSKEIEGSEQIIEILKHQQDRTRIPSLLPNDVEVAHKPGSLPEAVHDAGIVFTPNPFIFVFLSDEQKDKRLTTNILSECARLCHEYSTKS